MASNAPWVISPHGGEAQRFVADTAAPGGEFSPDYARIAYTDDTERPDEKEWERRVKRRDDGYFAEHKLTYSHVWVYDVASGKKTQLTTGDFDHSGSDVVAGRPLDRVCVESLERDGARPGLHEQHGHLPGPVGFRCAAPAHGEQRPGPQPDASRRTARRIAYLSSDRANSRPTRTT
jgi:hypothetical protein